MWDGQVSSAVGRPKVADPRQLAEINSVFVTLEPHGGEKERPEGKRILFAFLGGEPEPSLIKRRREFVVP